MIKKRVTTDAHEPNAGYDFHIVWTIRKCIELLNFNEEGLKAVSLENLSGKDSEIVDPDGDLLLGVDLTKYFGGVNFKAAKKVVISQLKYSTKHPDLDWTASRICTSKKGGSEGSLINKLAKSFKAILTKFPDENISEKLSIKLVSNRPLSLNLKNTINKVQNALFGKSRCQQCHTNRRNGKMWWCKRCHAFSYKRKF